jgi:hypothetical protein
MSTYPENGNFCDRLARASRPPAVNHLSPAGG